MRKLSITLLFLLQLHAAIAQNKTEDVTLTDMLKIKTVGNISLTKDGKRAAFTVNTIENDENNKLDYKYRSQIFTVAITGNTTPVQLTTHKDGATKPTWSPDGKQMAFTRSVEDKNQIFIISMEGGEPMQLTKDKYGASNPKWSPDGKKILYSSSVPLRDLLQDSILNPAKSIPTWKMEKHGFDKNEHVVTNKEKPDPNGSLSQIRAYLDKNATDKKAIVLNKLNFQSESNVSSDMNFNHFFEINVSKDTAPRLLTNGFYNFNNADYTPNGKQIILSGDVDTAENQDRSLESELFIMDANGENFKMLLGEDGKRYYGA